MTTSAEVPLEAPAMPYVDPMGAYPGLLPRRPHDLGHPVARIRRSGTAVGNWLSCWNMIPTCCRT